MNRTKAVKFIAVQIFCALFLCSSAQNLSSDSLISSKIITLEGFWKKYNELSSSQRKFENISVLPGIFILHKTDTSPSNYQINVNNAKIRQLKNQFGIAAVGSYQENFNPGLDEDDLVYNRRFQGGLDWNIINNGYLSSRYKQQILKNENIIYSLQPEKVISANDYLLISHRIIYSFNQHKIALLEKRQQIISDKIETANELYLLKHLPKLELMQIIQQQVDVSSMFQIYQAYNTQLVHQVNTASIPESILPVFDIDPLKLTSMSSSTKNDSILKLQIKNLELENNSLKDISLKTQLRYNYYNLSNNSGGNRDFISAGLSVSIPLPLGSKANKNFIDSKAALLRFDQQANTRQQNLEMFNSIYEFRYKLKQYNNFYEKHKKYEELIRIERVKEKLEDLEFNPITALNLIDEMLSVEIEMLDIQQEMYLSLLDIITKTSEVDVLSVIMPHETKENKLPSEIMNKSVYIWSEAMMKYDKDYIDEYLKLNNIGNAIISIRKDAKNKTQAIELINKLNEKNITVEIMIGSNDMLSDKEPVKRAEGILSGLELNKLSALHLDVEPHTFSDWQENKEKYLSLYIDLIREVKTYCNSKGIKLNVSIPVFYPEAILRDIYASADKVYLMAYEHNDADFIMKKVKEEFTINAAKTVIALRAADFKNRPAFEKLIKELSMELNTDRFAMHDLESFIKLDEISIGGEK